MGILLFELKQEKNVLYDYIRATRQILFTNLQKSEHRVSILYFHRIGKIPPPAKEGRPATTKDNNALSIISGLTWLNRFTPCYQISQELSYQNIHCPTSSVWRRKKNWVLIIEHQKFDNH